MKSLFLHFSLTKTNLGFFITHSKPYKAFNGGKWPIIWQISSKSHFLSDFWTLCIAASSSSVCWRYIGNSIALLLVALILNRPIFEDFSWYNSAKYQCLKAKKQVKVLTYILGDTITLCGNISSILHELFTYREFL